MKDKTTALILSILLGGIGVDRFGLHGHGHSEAVDGRVLRHSVADRHHQHRHR